MHEPQCVVAMCLSTLGGTQADGLGAGQLLQQVAGAKSLEDGAAQLLYALKERLQALQVTTLYRLYILSW